MIKLNKTTILKLKKYLDDFHYHFLLTSLLGEAIYYINPLPDYYSVKAALKKTEERHQKLVSFFLLGDPIEKDVLKKELDDEVLEHLLSVEILNCDDDHYWFNNYVITSYSNCYFLVSNVYYYPTCQNPVQRPYIGPDTYWLSRLIIGQVYGNVLDLCTGSGIQAILAAKTAESVTAVDCDSEACRIARFNTMLNNVDDRVRVLCGNLYEPLTRTEKYDYIVSNPPFIPIPEQVDFPICGDGGADGLEIIRNIFAGYSIFLKSKGKGIMIGQGVGDKKQIHLKRDIEERFGSKKSELYIHERVPIERQAQQFAELAKYFDKTQSITPEMWDKTYVRRGIDSFYTFTLFVHNEEGECVEFNLDKSWHKDDVPVSKVSKVSKIAELFSITSQAGTSFVGDSEIIEFIGDIDGSRTIEEIVKRMPFKTRVKYGRDSYDKIVAKYNNVCAQLAQQGIIHKK